MEVIGAGVLVFILVLAVTKRQDNDQLGQEVFTPVQLERENGGSNAGIFLGVLAIAICLVIALGMGG